jgi:RNA polymerase sigma-70 factor (ECF subfamily)
MDKVIGVAGCRLSPTTQERLGALFEAHHGRLYRLARRLVSTPTGARPVRAIPARRAGPAAFPPACHTKKPGSGADQPVPRLRRQDVAAVRERRDPGSTDQVERHPEAALIARTIVWRALLVLPPRRRAVVVLHEIEGASAAEIAGLLGIAAVTVRWHLARGRQQLARILKDVRT